MTVLFYLTRYEEYLDILKLQKKYNNKWQALSVHTGN
jgi:hypothetical protein